MCCQSGNSLEVVPFQMEMVINAEGPFCDVDFYDDSEQLFPLNHVEDAALRQLKKLELLDRLVDEGGGGSVRLNCSLTNLRSSLNHYLNFIMCDKKVKRRSNVSKRVINVRYINLQETIDKISNLMHTMNAKVRHIECCEQEIKQKTRVCIIS